MRETYIFFSKIQLNFTDVVMMVFSFTLFLWSLRLFRNPEILTPDKFLYRWLYNRFVGLTEFDGEGKPCLTHRQVKTYALFVMMVSILGILIWGYVGER